MLYGKGAEYFRAASPGAATFLSAGFSLLERFRSWQSMAKATESTSPLQPGIKKTSEHHR